MSALHYPDLRIQGFRGFKDLQIPRLGRVTLITGKNNTGKSSLLEALRLHVNNAAPHVIYDILSFREEYIRGIDERGRSSDPENLFDVYALFHGFPRLSEDFAPIVVSTKGNTHPTELTIRVGWFVEEEDEDGMPRLIEREDGHFVGSEDTVAIVVNTEEKKQIRRLGTLYPYGPPRSRTSSRVLRPRLSDMPRMPHVFVSPYSGEKTDMLGQLWDEVALTDSEQNAVEALQIIEPRISAVSMVGGEASSEGRRAIVRAENISRPVPLRSFGDGVNRLFAIALSLVNAEGGILLIDEFENGLHHSVQLDVWRMVFRLAQSLDAQVFATTHSQDAIGAFQKAAAESSEDGVLLRLTRTGDDVIPTVANEDELAVATHHDVEVR